MGKKSGLLDLRPLSAGDPRVTRPLYTLGEVGRYLNVPASTLHAWARPGSGAAPLITVFPRRGHFPTVPFIGFAEAFVIKAAVDAGVPRHRVRPGVERIRERAGGVSYALASKLVYTDGAELLLEVLEDDDLEVARTSQKQFRRTVESQLRLITYGADDFAERIRLPRYGNAVVSVQPLVAGGKPLLEAGGGVRVKDLLDRADAGEPLPDVASDFGVPLSQVKDIVGNA